MANAEQFDVVVVGAGFASLPAAKTYLKCAPQTDLIIIDSNKTVGGVWAEENVYPGLRTNNLRGALEIPDFPFPDDLDAPHGEHIPGKSVHQYLVRYAEKFDLMRRMRYQTTVLEAEKIPQGWRLMIEHLGEKSTMTTAKLIVGTGLISRPQRMRIKGDESYNAEFLHPGALQREAPAVAKDPKVERVTVYGGSKYAYDSVYTFAAAGKEIDWVIRKSGHGPTWIPSIWATLPVFGKVWAEHLVTTRFVDWFSPFPWSLDGSGWWRSFLQRTWLGRKIVGNFWGTMGQQMLEQTGFDNHPNLKALHPDCDLFDIASNFAAVNYPTDVLDFVRSGQVKVHREDISHLSDHQIHLANGDVLKSDAFVASSGWQWIPTMNFKNTELHADIGVPSANYTDSQKAFWADWDKQADSYVMQQFPFLHTRPIPPRPEEIAKANPYDHPPNEKCPDYTPFRLYRTIAPPGLSIAGDRSLAFVGFGINISHSMKTEITGLWVYAYFNDLLTIDPCRDMKDQVYYETALMQKWSQRRHTYGNGRRFPDFLWDAIPWNDVLLRDLGLSGLRKGNWWREAFEAYEHRDYRGITDEWLTKQMAEGRIKERDW